MPNTSVIKAKLQMPHLGPQIINRDRLLEKMESYNDRRATCVIAPAGYGKTVLVKQFADSVNATVIWYQIDEFDNDPVQFFQYLIEGLTSKIENFHVDIPDFIQNNGGCGRQCYGLMSNIIAELELKLHNALIIVLDDFHLISEPEILELMGLFLEYAPTAVHIIISSRCQPDMPLQRMKSQGLIMEINQQDLCFTRSEIKDLFAVTDEDRDNAEKSRIFSFAAKLEGWALGLSLCKLFFEGYQDEPTDVNIKKTKLEIYNYMGFELFKNLPADIQEFLLVTSVLEIMTAESCNYLLDSSDAADKLEYIKAQNLFVIAIDNDNDIAYKYHHILKEFLLSMLAERRTRAFEKAGQYYYKKSMYQQAVECFDSSGDNAMLIKIIEEIGPLMLKRGNLRTLSDWLNVLKRKGITESRDFILLQGELLSYQGDFDKAEYWIDRAIPLLKEGDDRNGLCRAAIHKTRILRYHSSFAKSLEYMDTCIAQLGEIPDQYQLEIQTERVFSLWLTGDIRKAVAIAENTLYHTGTGAGPRVNERLFRCLPVLYMLQGDYNQALVHYEEVLGDCGHNLDILEQDSINYYVARIYRDRGDPARAFLMMKDSVERKIKLGMTGDIYILYMNMALVCIDLDRKRDILNYLCRAEESFMKMGGKWPFFLDLLHILKRVLASESCSDEEDTDSLIDRCVADLQQEWPYMLVVSSAFFISYYLQSNQADKAEKIYQTCMPFAQKSGFNYFISLLSGLKVSLDLIAGNRDAALQHTADCLKPAAAQEYVQQFISFPSLIAPLKIALLNDIEVNFTKKVIIRLSSQAVPMLIELLRAQSAEQRLKAVLLLKEIDAREVRTELSLLFWDENQAVRKTGFELYNEVAGTGDVPIKLFVRAMGNSCVFSYRDWDNPLRWRTSKAKELFAYLLSYRGRPVTTERILADVWPDMDVDRARNLFHTNLTHVKKQLKDNGMEASLIKTQAGYKMDTAAIACDVWESDGYEGYGEDQNYKKGSENLYLEDIYSEWTVPKRMELELNNFH